MHQEEKARIIERYNARLRQFGPDVRALASGPKERRSLRYRILREMGIQSGESVLDLGCGFGDFSADLVESGLKVDYVGYDINPGLISIARQRHPDARFEVADVQKDDFPMFDRIVSSSAFNLRLHHGDNYELIEDIMRVCFAHARRGVAIDLLTSYVDFQTPEAFHYEPERVLSIAKRITKRVMLRHDYPLYEFCVYLYPDFAPWRSKEGA